MLRDTNQTVPECYLHSLIVQFNMSRGIYNEPASLPTLLSGFAPSAGCSSLKNSISLSFDMKINGFICIASASQ
jgi:hypothetical protein